MATKNKVCYILSYRAPNYIRTTVLINALQNCENIELFLAINTSPGILRYLQTLLKTIKIHFKHKPNTYIIGFRGHEIYWFYRLLFPKSIFVFDEMMSPYDSIVNEQKKLSPTNIFSKFLHRIESSILHSADYVLTDTNLHAQYLRQTFDVSSEKLKVIYVGTDEALFKPMNVSKSSSSPNFKVFTYATFLPLHGLDVVLEAASQLSHYPIEFTIVGGKGKKKAVTNFLALMKQLNITNTKHIEWIDYAQLPNTIAVADLCLGGPFGGTPQARRVITGKTFQFLAMEKPTVVGYVKENVGFVDKNNCLVVEQADPDALASSILWAYENRLELTSIAKNGRKLFSKKFSTLAMTRSLLELGAFSARV